MDKLGLFIWIVSASTLMGIFVLIVLIVPALAKQETMLMIPAAISGAIVAIPLSIYATKKNKAVTDGK